MRPIGSLIPDRLFFLLSSDSKGDRNMVEYRKYCGR